MTKFLEGVEIKYLKPENSAFRMTKGGLVELEYTADGKTEVFSPVVLHLAFPFMKPREYVSVFGKNNEEIGIVEKLDDFDPETADILHSELRRRYFTPVIRRIDSIKERFGFSYWKVQTDKGEINFAVSDTYKSIIRFSAERYIIIDADGNRYSVNNINELDGQSVKRLEMYV
jgi:hypothetical protein